MARLTQPGGVMSISKAHDDRLNGSHAADQHRVSRQAVDGHRKVVKR
jgi:hypothetical protein